MTHVDFARAITSVSCWRWACSVKMLLEVLFFLCVCVVGWYTFGLALAHVGFFTSSWCTCTTTVDMLAYQHTRTKGSQHRNRQ